MKFNCIIMNPPYKRDLHLKVLAKAIQTISPDGVVLNISPVRWLQDPTAQYKKNTEFKRFEDSVSKHIKHLEIIDGETARKSFNIAIMTDVAIYKCTKDGGFDYASLATKLPCFDKITKRIANGEIDNLKRHMKIYHGEPISNFMKMSLIHGNPGKHDFYDVVTPRKAIAIPNNFVKISLIHGHPGKRDFYDVVTPRKAIAIPNNFVKISLIHGHPGKRDFYDVVTPRKATATGILKENTRYFSFDTENERDNFYDSLNSIFMKYCLRLCKTNQNILPQFLPWLGDYTHKWTDDDICSFLNLNEAEQKEIKNIMRKYDYEV